MLKGLSFAVKSCQKIGIVGRTGAGKSTIQAALARLVELSGGKIMIDGIDIAKLDLSLLREKITFIPQDPCLFTGTLRYNIDPFNRFSDEEIDKLARRAGLAEVLLRKQTAEMIAGRATRERKRGKSKKTKKKRSAHNQNDALQNLSGAARESLEKGGVHFWLTENGSNLSVGER